MKRDKFNFRLTEEYYLLYLQGPTETDIQLTFEIEYNAPYFRLYTFPKHKLVQSSLSLANLEGYLKEFDIVTLEGAFDTLNLEDSISKFCSKGKERVCKRFKELRKQVKPWLKMKYGIIPDRKDFIDWYGKNVLRAHLKKSTYKIWVSKTSYIYDQIVNIAPIGSYAITFYPKLETDDLQKYCVQLDQKMNVNDLIFRKLPYPVSKPIENKPEIVTLEWRGTLHQLDKLYEKLKLKFIDCTLEEFRGIFGIGKLRRPVKWIESLAALVVFIKFLQRVKLIPTPDEQDLLLIQSLFIEKNNKKFKRSSLKTYFASLKPDTLSNRSKDLEDTLSEIL